MSSTGSKEATEVEQQNPIQAEALVGTPQPKNGEKKFPGGKTAEEFRTMVLPKKESLVDGLLYRRDLVAFAGGESMSQRKKTWEALPPTFTYTEARKATKNILKSKNSFTPFWNGLKRLKLIVPVDSGDEEKFRKAQ